MLEVTMTVRLSPSIVISVGVHALLAAGWWLVDVDPPPRVEEPGHLAQIELVETQPEAVEVVMLDAAALAQLAPVAPPSTPPTPAPPAPMTRATPKPRPAIAAAATTTRPEIAMIEPPVEPHRTSSLMNLRKGVDLEGRGRDSVRLTRDALERIANGPETAPTSVVVDHHEGAIVDPKVKESLVTAEITPGGRGGYKIDDLVFKGRIEADGSVSIKDKRNIQHQFTSWANVKRVLRAAGPLGLLALEFDVTDALMRKKKIDPYASRKLAFLDETRDARVELGKEHRKEVLAKTAIIVRQNLDATWMTIPDHEERKRALFEIWDEVDETGDEDLVEAGKSARAAVIGFIRGRLPRGGEHAFTALDLERFNRTRKSRAVFAPYE